ncbi:hypothetical protein HY486_01390 [Candidatus Woesearchaeota archaeon]|nr:hypothetical protein [Candidatus Woesearchaeota archaeon]
MKLEQLGTTDAYLYLERYVNQPKYSPTAQYSEAETKYHPRKGNGVIGVPYTYRDDARCLTAYPDARLLKTMTDSGFRLYMHPQYAEGVIAGTVIATPTSSTRTVLAQDVPNHFIKLHFPGRISRFHRRLRPDSVQHSIEVSGELEESLESAPSCFAYLPESIGVYLKGAYGCIIREAVARPVIQGRALIPFFSLYSKDPLGDEPLLVQIVKESGRHPLEAFVEQIVMPYLSAWTFFARERGILLEAHCQNTLLEVDENYKPSRIVFRDFQSDMIDPIVRQEKGLRMPFSKHLIGGMHELYPRKVEYSIVYDHFVASYVFPYFIACLKEYFGISEKETQNEIQQVFRALFPNQLDVFPETEFTLTDKVDGNNNIEAVNTNELPRFR